MTIKNVYEVFARFRYGLLMTNLVLDTLKLPETTKMLKKSRELDYRPPTDKESSE